MVRAIKAITILSFLIVVLPIILAEAQESPPLPLQLYGRAVSFNTPVAHGTIITAIDTEGNACGRFTVTYSGYFGVLSCRGENTTLDGTGASQGENIRFRIGAFPTSILFGNTIDSIGNLYWESGVYKEITIVAPPIICGDGFCDRYESCSTCPEDCGECPVTPPGIPDSRPPEGPPRLPDFGLIDDEPIVIDCVESWSCSDWSICYPNGTQTRECIDVNACGTDEDKPETLRECIYEEPPPREEVPREITERPRPEEILVVRKCDERLPILSVASLVFIMLFLIIVVVPLLHMRSARKKIVRDKYAEEMDKLKAVYHLERKTYTFIIIVSVLGAIVYLYHYLFFLCKDVYYANLWLLALFVFLSPVVIHVLIAVMKYSEKAKMRKMRLLNNSYYRHVMYLIKITNEQLSKSENEITQKIYLLGQDGEFHDLVTGTKEIRNIYYDMTKLFTLYKEGKQASKVEKDLLSNMEKLDKNEAFSEAALKHPELDSLKSNLALLYKAYESKQELYDELRRIEKAAEDAEEGSGDDAPREKDGDDGDGVVEASEGKEASGEKNGEGPPMGKDSEEKK